MTMDVMQMERWPKVFLVFASVAGRFEQFLTFSFCFVDDLFSLVRPVRASHSNVAHWTHAMKYMLHNLLQLLVCFEEKHNIFNVIDLVCFHKIVLACCIVIEIFQCITIAIFTTFSKTIKPSPSLVFRYTSVYFSLIGSIPKYLRSRMRFCASSSLIHVKSCLFRAN
jgi:hypothetical protein